jgi:hypothetical protein
MMKTRYIKKNTTALLMLLITLITLSCKKFLNLEPPIDKVSSELVFDNDEAAKSSITGIYSRMSNSGIASGDLSSISVLAGLCADELESYSISYDPYYKNSLVPGNLNSWTEPYQFIYSANAILEGLDKTTKVSNIVKDQIKGEALFIRGFWYFYLTNLFGEVPLHLTTDYRINTNADQASQSEIYQSILIDLLKSTELLGEAYYTPERVRPNKWVAHALLSRVYLYTKNWEMAEAYATSIIDKKDSYVLVDDLNQVFLSNSKEAIWQLSINKPGQNTNEGNQFILTSRPLQVSLSTKFDNEFQAGDKRKTAWTGNITVEGETYFYPFKYKIKTSTTAPTEYSMVFRLAEQYLIRAEARVKLGKTTGINSAESDLNFIRNRAGLGNTTASTEQSILAAIEQERKYELFTEWGHRWLDLKRSGHAETILKPIKGSFWQNTDQLFPIPQTELNANPLISQNHGY